MRGGNQSFSIQIKSVLDEYERALKDGATLKATAIRAANPDLATRFDLIAAVEKGTLTRTLGR